MMNEADQWQWCRICWKNVKKWRFEIGAVSSAVAFRVAAAGWKRISFYPSHWNGECIWCCLLESVNSGNPFGAPFGGRILRLKFNYLRWIIRRIGRVGSHTNFQPSESNQHRINPLYLLLLCRSLSLNARILRESLIIRKNSLCNFRSITIV